MKQSISNHNKNILRKMPLDNKTQEERKCNCRQPEQCPLQRNCLEAGVVYQATVTETDSDSKKTYIGLTKNSFKTRYTQHKSSFKLVNKRSSTTLSEHIWGLRDRNISYRLEWEVLAKRQSVKPGQNVCSLCLEEKFCINKCTPAQSLNRRKEMFGFCVHQKKHLLNAWRPPDNHDRNEKQD